MPACRLAKYGLRARTAYPLSGVLVRCYAEAGCGFRPVTPHPFILPSPRAHIPLAVRGCHKRGGGHGEALSVPPDRAEERRKGEE